MSETSTPTSLDVNASASEPIAPAETPVPQVVPQLTAGLAIRQAREAAGLTVGHLAASLKVSAKTILALEDNNMAALPDLAFSRALAASICRTLKIDVNYILGLMPSLPQPHVVTNQEVGLNLPMARAFKLNFSLTWFKSSTFAILAAVALATLAVANWPVVMEWLNKFEKSNTPAATASSDAVALALPSANANEGSVVTTAAVPAPVASTANAASVSASAPPAGAVPVSPAMPAFVGPANQLVFKATGSSWIEVTDMNGKTVWKKLLAANESVPVAAPIPARVLIGNVAGTSLTVNDAVFDVMPFSANNIARFEVK